MPGFASSSEITRTLKGINLPADKRALTEHARSNNAPGNVIAA